MRRSRYEALSILSLQITLLPECLIFHDPIKDFITCDLNPLCSDLVMVLDFLQLPACSADHPLLDLILRAVDLLHQHDSLAASMLAAPSHEDIHAQHDWLRSLWRESDFQTGLHVPLRIGPTFLVPANPVAAESWRGDCGDEAYKCAEEC